MSQQELTFEEINEHIEKADLSVLEAVPTDTKDLAAVQSRLCAVYYVIRPILKGVLLIPFIPKKWKSAIKAFMEVMDTLCPS